MPSSSPLRLVRLEDRVTPSTLELLSNKHHPEAVGSIQYGHISIKDWGHGAHTYGGDGPLEISKSFSFVAGSIWTTEPSYVGDRLFFRHGSTSTTPNRNRTLFEFRANAAPGSKIESALLEFNYTPGRSIHDRDDLNPRQPPTSDVVVVKGYEADGRITTEDYDRPTLGEVRLTLPRDTSNGTAKIDVAPILNELTEKGVRRIGLRLEAGAADTRMENIFLTNLTIVDERFHLDVPDFDQFDSRWKTELLGNSTTSTIGRYGCKLTALAMMLRAAGVSAPTPAENAQFPLTLQNWLRDTKAFSGKDGDLLTSTTAVSIVATQLGFAPKSFRYVEQSEVVSREKLRSLLRDRQVPVMLRVPGISNPAKSHFVVVTGYEGNDYLINDPGSNKTRLSEYGMTTGSMLIRGYIDRPASIAPMSRSARASADADARPMLVITASSPNSVGLDVRDPSNRFIGPNIPLSGVMGFSEQIDALDGGPPQDILEGVVIDPALPGSYFVQIQDKTAPIAFTTFDADGRLRSHQSITGFDQNSGVNVRVSSNGDVLGTTPSDRPIPGGAGPGFALGSGSTGTAILYGSAGIETRRIDAYPEFTGGTRVAAGDLNNDGIADLITAPGPGLAPLIRIFDGETGEEIASFFAFEETFLGGVFIAAADLNSDGAVDILLSPDVGGGPRLRVIDGRTRASFADFFAIDDVNFRGGVRIGTGDLNADGTPDVLVGAGFGGGPRVALFDGKSLLTGDAVKLADDFFVFEEGLRNGVFLTAGDLDGDGHADLIAGAGPGGGPRVYGLSGASLTQSGSLTPLMNFFAGDAEARGGVRVLFRDADGDGEDELIAAPGEGSLPVVSTYRREDLASGAPSLGGTRSPFDPREMAGIFVG